MKKTFFAILSIVLAIALLSGCVQPDDGNGLPDAGNDTGQINGGNNMIEKVETGDSIAVEYKGTLEDGTQFDASEGRGPLEFIAGTGQMIKGFDTAVIGMALNEEKTVTMEPSQAYGETDQSKIEEIEKSHINGAENLKVGMSVTNPQTGANGIVKEIKDDVIVIDFNHQLAGKKLTFWIKVVKIEK